MEGPVDRDPGPDLLGVVLPVLPLVGLAGQVEGELARLRVDIDVVVVPQVVQEILVNFEFNL